MNTVDIDRLSRISCNYSNVEYEVIFVLGGIQDDVQGVFESLSSRFSIHNFPDVPEGCIENKNTIVAWLAIQSIPEIVRELSNINVAVYHVVLSA